MARIRRQDLGVHTLFTTLDTGDGIFNAVQANIRAAAITKARIAW